MKLVKCKKQFSGRLTEGCKQCIKGRKSVIFVTGICHYKCFYCPISDDKRRVDIVKVNELILKNPDEPEAIQQMFDEIKKCQSWGCSFTGGDPLAKIDRTVNYIKELKNNFGKKFHIHLYASLEFLNQEKVTSLENAGLDELRLHPDIENPKTWEKMLIKTKMQLGIEVPAIPDKLKETKKLIDFAKKHNFKFINLNELEISDTNDTRLSQRKYKLKDNISYAIKKSEETALKLVEYGNKINFPVHYCSCQFKDAVQLANRLRLRAESIRKSYDYVDEEGMITTGEIFKEKGKITLKEFEEIKEYFDIPDELMAFEKGKIRMAYFVLEDIWQEIKKDFPKSKSYCAEITRKYPTSDELILEKEIL